MPKITMGVLSEKIDASHELLLDIKKEVKMNTEFRLKATGFAVAIATISAMIGGFIGWIMKFIGRS